MITIMMVSMEPSSSSFSAPGYRFIVYNNIDYVIAPRIYICTHIIYGALYSRDVNLDNGMADCSVSATRVQYYVVIYYTRAREKVDGIIKRHGAQRLRRRSFTRFCRYVLTAGHPSPRRKRQQCTFLAFHPIYTTLYTLTKVFLPHGFW